MVGVYFRRLERLFAQYRSKVEGCLELYFFGLSQQAAGEIFRKGLTKSRRQPGLNVFSEHNSEGWRGFLEWINPKSKAVWRERFFGVHFQRLERLFGVDQPKVESRLA